MLFKIECGFMNAFCFSPRSMTMLYKANIWLRSQGRQRKES